MISMQVIALIILPSILCVVFFVALLFLRRKHRNGEFESAGIYFRYTRVGDRYLITNSEKPNFRTAYPTLNEAMYQAPLAINSLNKVDHHPTDNLQELRK